MIETILYFVWHTLLYQPIYNALIFFYLYNPIRDMGVAVILLTIFMRIVLLPFSIRAARSEYRLAQLEPLFAEIHKRYKYNVEKQREATRALLKKHKIGIFSNLVSLFFQILVFLILYRVFSSGLQPYGDENILYPFFHHVKVVGTNFFGSFSLLIPYLPASLCAAGLTLLLQGTRKVQGHLTSVDRAALIFFPIGIFLATIALPSGKAIFLCTSMLFTLWIRLVKVVVVRYVIKDKELKEGLDQLWKS
ncbi:MAG: YidC/Oxa1 family membrane protein insertase [Candidatus Kerfeldbacteria bacterium]|nr:YidC/Oxa1 family membrane protein insertase [Candidatus Kerfeldbacteria bacterium]